MHTANPISNIIKNEVFKTYADAVKKGDLKAAKSLADWISQVIITDGSLKIEDSLSIVLKALRSTFDAKHKTDDGKEINLADLVEKQMKSTDVFQGLGLLSANPEKVFLGEEPIALTAVQSAANASVRSATRKPPQGQEKLAEGQMVETMANIYQGALKELSKQGLQFRSYEDPSTRSANLEHNTRVQEVLEEIITSKLKENAGSFSKDFLKKLSVSTGQLIQETESVFMPLIKSGGKLREALLSDDCQKVLDPGDLTQDDLQNVSGKVVELNKSVGKHLNALQEIQASNPEAIPLYLNKLSREEKIFLNTKLKESEACIDAVKTKESMSATLANFGLKGLFGSAMFGYIFGFVLGMPMLGAGITTALTLVGNLTGEANAPLSKAKVLKMPPQPQGVTVSEIAA